MIVLSRKCDRLFLKIQERFLAFYRVQLKRISPDAVVSCEVDRSRGVAALDGSIRLIHSVSFSENASNGILGSRSNEFSGSSLHPEESGGGNLGSAVSSPQACLVATDAMAHPLGSSVEQQPRKAVPAEGQEEGSGTRSGPPGPEAPDENNNNISSSSGGSGRGGMSSSNNRSTETAAPPTRLAAAELGILAHSDFICAWQVQLSVESSVEVVVLI